MDLDITHADVVKVGGRAALPLSIVASRELGPADLVRLEAEQGIKPTPIARISDRHHALAKCLAQGQSPQQAGLLTGYSSSRISILQNDPSFKELMAFYREEKDIIEAAAIERVSNMTLTALALIEDRMENNPDELKTRELLDIATVGLDRTGHGPSSNVNIKTLTLSAEEMAKLAANSKDANVTTIEARAQGAGAFKLPVGPGRALAEGSVAGITREGNGVPAGDREGAPQAVLVGPVGDGTVDQVHGCPGDELCAAGSLSGAAADGAADRMQAETEHQRGGSAVTSVPPSAGETLQSPSVHDTSVPALALCAEQVSDQLP